MRLTIALLFLNSGLAISAGEPEGQAARKELAKPLNTLIDKVTKHAYQVTDEDIAAVRAFGLSEDQIFEMVVCAAIGQATRQYDTALAALAAVTDEEGVSHAPRDPR